MDLRVRHGRRQRVWFARIVGVVCAVVTMVGLDTSTVAAQTKMRDMSFGSLFPGIPKLIPPTDGAAAQWRYQAVLTLNLGISFTLPNSLSRVGGGGSLPISFCSTCAIYRRTTDNPVGGTVFNPVTGVSGLSLSLLATIYVWLGATVSPTVTQPAGSYTGTVTVTITIL